jgi:hypothetical protein
MSQPEIPPPPDAIAAQLLDHVAEYGWGVVAWEEDSLGPAYAFSVGLWRGHRHPEIVVVGLKGEAAHVLINALGDAITGGRSFTPGQRYEGFVPGFAVSFVLVNPAHVAGLFGHACWYNAGDDFPVVQCVWPDEAGLFPWEAGFDERFYEKQPLLDQPLG